MPVDQWIPERELLGHADQRVVDGNIAMGVILAQNISNNTRALLIWLVPEAPEFIHGKEDSPMYWFQPIAKVRQCTTNNDTHRILEVRLLHLILDVNVKYSIVFRHQFPSLR